VPLCLVELRGFEPLTPCMPSRNPGTSAPTQPRITRHHTETVVVTHGVSHGLVRLELLPRCCPPTIMSIRRCGPKVMEASAVWKCDSPGGQRSCSSKAVGHHYQRTLSDRCCPLHTVRVWPHGRPTPRSSFSPPLQTVVASDVRVLSLPTTVCAAPTLG
jgi:hypothetical protein